MLRAKEAERGKFQLWHINKYKLNRAKLGEQLSKIISAHDSSDESVLQSISVGLQRYEAEKSGKRLAFCLIVA